MELTLNNDYWEVILRILHPNIKANPDVVKFLPDYGLHLRRLGAVKGVSVYRYGN